MEHTAEGPALNLTSAVRTKQIRLGVVIFGVALAGTVLLRSLGVVTPLRYLMFLPFLVAFHGIAMGLTGLCGVSAACGVRQTEDGMEPVVDKNELADLRRRGAAVFATTLGSALGATLSLLH